MVQAKRYVGNEYQYLIYKDGLSLVEANRLESRLIRKYKRVVDGGTLWDLSLGGQGRPGRIRYPGGFRHSDEVRTMSLEELHYFNLVLKQREMHAESR